MGKITLTIIFGFVLSQSAKSQITKNNWILSGNVSISSLKSSSTAFVQFKQTDIQLVAGVGHFFYDKVAIGIRPSLTYGNNNIANSSTVFGIGPFVRYYFFVPENIVNLFVDAGYLYGAISGEQKSNTLALYAGPVIFFNASVGLEFLMGYSTTKVVGFDGRNNKLQFGIGFQFHLEKEK